MPDREPTRADTLLFIACLVVASALRLLPADVQAAVGGGIRRVAEPLVWVQRQVIELKAVRSELERVRSERDAVLVAALRARELEQENEELRRLLALTRRLEGSFVSASILQQAGRTDGVSFLLSAGRRDGVVERAPVVAAAGLVGVVVSVAATTSIGIGWPHPDFRVSAMTADGSVFGIVGALGTQGPNTLVLELRGVPYGERVARGTPVWTSGLGGVGGVYPRGIPVGTVIDVAHEEPGWSRTYRVRPAVHPASVSHVVILLNPRFDLTGRFDRP